eukprot:maker-scaffold_114-snap-gene-0.16-mRNA-1 protein AED:0.46 eAED:0.63 QI:0/0/0/1/0/0/3/0/111
MVSYACVRRSQGKLRWRFEVVLTCKSITEYEHRGERLIEPSSSWIAITIQLKCTSSAQRSHKRCWFSQTAGRWPWKSESAKECVTTHLPNELALKMDCALAGYLCSAIHVK